MLPFQLFMRFYMILLSLFFIQFSLHQNYIKLWSSVFILLLEAACQKTSSSGHMCWGDCNDVVLVWHAKMQSSSHVGRLGREKTSWIQAVVTQFKQLFVVWVMLENSKIMCQRIGIISTMLHDHDYKILYFFEILWA